MSSDFFKLFEKEEIPTNTKRRRCKTSGDLSEDEEPYTALHVQITL
jgi:hypothetical protein